MIGIILAVLSALFFAVGDVGKKILSGRLHPFLVNWIPVSCGVLLGGFVFGSAGAPPVTGGSLLPLAALSGLLLFFIEIAFLRSIRDAELSLVMPLTAFVPVVSGLVAWFAHGEEPSRGAIVGIVIVVLASWLMFAEAGDWRQVLRPFQRMLDDLSARYMLIFSLLTGIFVNFVNAGGDRSSGSYFLWLVLIVEWLILSALLVARRTSPFPGLRANLGVALMTGVFWALGMAAFFEALSFTLVAYAMAAKCTHTIFIVVLGYLVFRERDFRKRVGASSLLVLGLCVLLLGH